MSVTPAIRDVDHVRVNFMKNEKSLDWAYYAHRNLSIIDEIPETKHIYWVGIIDLHQKNDKHSVMFYDPLSSTLLSVDRHTKRSASAKESVGELLGRYADSMSSGFERSLFLVQGVSAGGMQQRPTDLQQSIGAYDYNFPEDMDDWVKEWGYGQFMWVFLHEQVDGSGLHTVSLIRYKEKGKHRYGGFSLQPWFLDGPPMHWFLFVDFELHPDSMEMVPVFSQHLSDSRQ